jgi:hypothetical protein
MKSIGFLSDVTKQIIEKRKSKQEVIDFKLKIIFYLQALKVERLFDASKNEKFNSSFLNN